MAGTKPYSQQRRIAAFWMKVNPAGPPQRLKNQGRLVRSRCWMWCGSVWGNGYGCFSLNGDNQQAHRVAYELLVGPIPPGREIDHLCCVRTCVNPDHMEPVKHQVNIRRGKDRGCRKGHPWTAENTIVRYRHGYKVRRCRICKEAREEKTCPKN